MWIISAIKIIVIIVVVIVVVFVALFSKYLDINKNDFLRKKKQQNITVVTHKNNLVYKTILVSFTLRKGCLCHIQNTKIQASLHICIV